MGADWKLGFLFVAPIVILVLALVAYPFSGRPTPHRVRFADGHEVHAMCALDALGVAPMFGEQIESLYT